MSKIKLSWGDRFAVIDHYKPTDAQICAVFGLPQDELDTARTLRSAGTFAANTQYDVSKFADVFATLVATPSTKDVVGSASVISMVQTKPTTTTTHTKPETATKKIKIAQKRGRKGNKIEIALLAVSETPTPVDVFIKQHGISLAVLRQSKRFIEKLDPVVQTAIGTINVKQDKETKVLQIWSEKS